MGGRTIEAGSQKSSEPGDSVILKFGWLSEGVDECPSSMYHHGKYCQSEWPCAHRSISCLAGTGDFRIGLFDSKTGKTDKVHRDNFASGKRYGDMIKNLEKYPFRYESSCAIFGWVITPMCHPTSPHAPSP
eukprot:1899471-Pyramimonas_sp.AAC.1